MDSDLVARRLSFGSDTSSLTFVLDVEPEQCAIVEQKLATLKERYRSQKFRLKNYKLQEELFVALVQSDTTHLQLYPAPGKIEELERKYQQITEKKKTMVAHNKALNAEIDANIEKIISTMANISDVKKQKLTKGFLSPYERSVRESIVADKENIGTQTMSTQKFQMLSWMNMKQHSDDLQKVFESQSHLARTKLISVNEETTKDGQSVILTLAMDQEKPQLEDMETDAKGYELVLILNRADNATRFVLQQAMLGSQAQQPIPIEDIVSVAKAENNCGFLFQKVQERILNQKQKQAEVQQALSKFGEALTIPTLSGQTMKVQFGQVQWSIWVHHDYPATQGRVPLRILQATTTNPNLVQSDLDGKVAEVNEQCHQFHIATLLQLLAKCSDICK